jgi:hypothetical protein
MEEPETTCSKVIRGDIAITKRRALGKTYTTLLLPQELPAIVSDYFAAQVATPALTVQRHTPHEQQSSLRPEKDGPPGLGDKVEAGA